MDVEVGLRSRRGPGVVLALAALLALVPSASCVTARHTVEPYRTDPGASLELARAAWAACLARRESLPPREFTTDGCSSFPDGDWAECCVRHDIEYWCGGSAAARRAADRELARCVADEPERPALGRMMQAGVRVGGSPVWPAPWRWDYGRPWPTGYAEDAVSRAERKRGEGGE